MTAKQRMVVALVNAGVPDSDILALIKAVDAEEEHKRNTQQSSDAPTLDFKRLFGAWVKQARAAFKQLDSKHP